MRSPFAASQRACRAFAATVVLGLLLVLPSSALAAVAPGPHWTMMAIPTPTQFHAGAVNDFYEVVAVNDGGAASSGPVVITDVLPAGVTVTSARALVEKPRTGAGEYSGMGCEESKQAGVVTVTCTTAEGVPSGQLALAKIDVDIPAKAAGDLRNVATISGGGAQSASDTTETPITPSGQAVPFGASIRTSIVEASGAVAKRAGSHPYAYTTLLAYNTAGVNLSEHCGAELGPPQLVTTGCAQPIGDPHDLEVALPPGLIGDPSAVPRCPQAEFQSRGWTECPAATQVGIADISFFGEATQRQFVPVYNVVPPPGQAAELGFSVSSLGHVGMFFRTRGDGEGLNATVSDVTEFVPVRAVAMTIWGVPAEESHTALRMSTAPGAECGAGGPSLKGGCVSHAELKPFLSMPTGCRGGPLSVGLGVDSWQQPLALPLPMQSTAQIGEVEGCEALALGTPAIEVDPSTRQAGSPSGYSVHLKVPQSEEAGGLATPQLRDVEVTMPEGTVISPSAANGLQACTEEQFGATTEHIGQCPAQSAIGKVKITSPLIETPITGSVYVGAPECSPCTAKDAEEGKMVKLLLEAQLPNPNEASMTQAERKEQRPPVLIKLAGRTRIDPRTGRLKTVFTENPQLPFDELELTLENGPTAPLVNPTTCGTIAATAHLTAWSALTNSEGTITDPGSEANISSPPVPIEGCGTAGFSPSFSAGMTTSQRAGAFSGFSVTLDRPDGQQTLGSVTVHTPPGLVGMLSKVQLCNEPQANEGTCPATSQIGTTTVVTGPGSDPYTINGGRVYLTGPYDGAPFGLSIVVPAEAGPFHLAGLTGSGGEGVGNVVVRGSIAVDPHTAALTITTNPIPTQLEGIPVQVRRVIVQVDREGFMFNPTSCDATSIGATIDSSSGAVANLSYPFQSVNCAVLPFKPGFSVTTHAGHTRRYGAYLGVKVTSSQGQANIKSVYVELPKVLVARESTLKAACTEKQFEANPAGCPQGSYVGTAVARTPVLPVPLTGPAIFVSHGGAAFPDMDVVLQGDGVTVDLTGSTNIVKDVTSSDFKSVPDVPVSSFELTLPEDSHSALTATANLCTQTVTKRVKRKVRGKVVYRRRSVQKKRSLKMPTTITGQNGSVVRSMTIIGVEGCGKSTKKPAKKAQPAKRRHK